MCYVADGGPQAEAGAAPRPGNSEDGDKVLQLAAAANERLAADARADLDSEANQKVRLGSCCAGVSAAAVQLVVAHAVVQVCGDLLVGLRLPTAAACPSHPLLACCSAPWRCLGF